MAWDRRGGREYYYWAVRTPAGPRRVYLGTGPDAATVYAAVRLRRTRRAADARARRAAAERHAAADGPLDALARAADLLVRAALLAAGYHRHDRGPWRLKRARPERTDRTDRPDRPAAGPPAVPAGRPDPDAAGRGG